MHVQIWKATPWGFVRSVPCTPYHPNTPFLQPPRLHCTGPSPPSTPYPHGAGYLPHPPSYLPKHATTAHMRDFYIPRPPTTPPAPATRNCSNIQTKLLKSRDSEPEGSYTLCHRWLSRAQQQLLQCGLQRLLQCGRQTSAQVRLHRMGLGQALVAATLGTAVASVAAPPHVKRRVLHRWREGAPPFLQVPRGHNCLLLLSCS